mmetsp:Transcript_27044/g.77431  ORF Transcript_27044/g.77431 Transcript_27044/m.77431 type:complete len:382 (+) Transcript_27044:144-1289(+)
MGAFPRSNGRRGEGPRDTPQKLRVVIAFTRLFLVFRMLQACQQRLEQRRVLRGASRNCEVAEPLEPFGELLGQRGAAETLPLHRHQGLLAVRVEHNLEATARRGDGGAEAPEVLGDEVGAQNVVALVTLAVGHLPLEAPLDDVPRIGINPDDVHGVPGCIESLDALLGPLPVLHTPGEHDDVPPVRTSLLQDRLLRSLPMWLASRPSGQPDTSVRPSMRDDGRELCVDRMDRQAVAPHGRVGVHAQIGRHRPDDRRLARAGGAHEDHSRGRARGVSDDADRPHDLLVLLGGQRPQPLPREVQQLARGRPKHPQQRGILGDGQPEGMTLDCFAPNPRACTPRRSFCPLDLSAYVVEATENRTLPPQCFRLCIVVCTRTLKFT